MMTWSNGNRKLMRAVLVVAVVICLTSGSPVTAGLGYKVTITEVGPSLPPGQDSADLAFESNPEGTHYLISGYGRAGEYRVLDGDLSTVKVLEPPVEGLTIKGCTFSDWRARVLMWCQPSGGGAYSLHLYDVDAGEFVEGFMPNGTPQVETIDHARIYAGELMVLVAGQDVNGSSQVVFLETNWSGLRAQVSVPGDRKVIHSDDNGNFVPVMDEEGGVLVFGSFNWTLLETIPPMNATPTVYEIHTDRHWTTATEDGTVTIGPPFGLGFRYSHQLEEGPVQGALYIQLENKALVMLTARPGGKGGSLMEAWWAGGEPWKRFYKENTDKAVAFIHHVPGEDLMYLVGYEDGSVVQYSIEIKDIPPKPRDPWYTEWNNILPFVVLGVVLLLVVRRAQSRSEGKD